MVMRYLGSLVGRSLLLGCVEASVGNTQMDGCDYMGTLQTFSRSQAPSCHEEPT